MRNNIPFYLCGLGGTMLPFIANAKTQPKKQLPNIIYIMCDDMGYGDLGCYGQQYIHTPNIDQLAREGMRFTQAYAGSPVSAPSRATLMTGQHTGHTTVRGNKEYWRGTPTVRYGVCEEYTRTGQHPYDPNHVILPEIMKDQGYTTGMFGKWAGGYEGSCSTPDKRGIDEYYGYICQFQAHAYYPNFLNRYSRSAGDTCVVRELMEENIKYPMENPGYKLRTQYSADIIHQHAMDWLNKQSADQPFFGIFTYTLPHAELLQPEDSIFNKYKEEFYWDRTWGGHEPSRYHESEHVHAQFAGMITRLDAYVGQIMALLKEKGLDENTLVIFTSDNGPHEEGGADPEFFGRDGKLRGLKRQCYEGGIRIPFIAHWPGHVAEGTTNDHQLAFYDVMPTFCDLTGVKNFAKKYTNKELPGDGFDGISFAPTLLGDNAQQQEHPWLYWEFSETNQMGLRMGDWKLVVVEGAPRLYNLAEDLHEDHNVASEHPEIVKQMVDILREQHRDSEIFPVTLPKEEISQPLTTEANADGSADFTHKGSFCLIDSTDDADAIVRKAANIVPSERQFNWQRQELTAFLHFGVNTYTGRSWGDGKEDPAIFNPTKLDAEQWITALQDGGFKCAILTCKHHDGFCLWPSAQTEHSVKNSPWKDGKGDVVKEVADACHRHGMGFGVYLSPWDRNCPLYGTDEYNDFFVRQLTELLTNYGQVDEVWFDGACGEGPNGKKQEYDFVRWYKLIRKLQPKAVISIMGPDCRWVGTESGKGREQEWSVVPNSNLDQKAISDNSQHDVLLQPMGDRRQADLGSRSVISKAKGLVWYPAETDVSIRPEWFWHPKDDNSVKSVDELMNIYFTSVGCNGVLLLNIPPNKDGLLCDQDVAAIKEFRQRRDLLFAHNLLADAYIRDADGHDAKALADGNYDTSCTVACPEIEKPVTVSTTYNISWPEAKTFSTLMLQEDIRQGQHVESFGLEIQDDNGIWREVAHGTTIGYKRLLQFPATMASKARLVIKASRLNPVLAEVGLY